jgi:hypothetical protein
MRIDALTVCVNYADFLALTLPHNLRFVDRLLVVTEEGDKDTQRLCSYHNVPYIFSRRVHENGAAFNKSKAINEGWKTLAPRGQFLLIDADTLIPPSMDRAYFSNPDHFYCSYRVYLNSYEEYEQWYKGKYQPPQPAVNDAGGGYFQCFNINSQYLCGLYPEAGEEGVDTDLDFLSMWPTASLNIIPWTCAHIGPINTNFSGGRVSPVFHPLPQDVLRTEPKGEYKVRSRKPLLSSVKKGYTLYV